MLQGSQSARPTIYQVHERVSKLRGTSTKFQEKAVSLMIFSCIELMKANSERHRLRLYPNDR